MTTTITLHIGDVVDILPQLQTGAADCLITSPPFLALRSYLPADHPDKHREIGSEPDPATYLDTLLSLTAQWGRILPDWASICVELGDTYSGSGGGGGDYLPGGPRQDQPGFGGSAERQRDGNAAHWRQKNVNPTGWPLPKSLTGIPTLYPWSLAYGRNLLTGAPSPAGPWRIRNIIVWARPNPPVGALGDKYRPATSYITVATRSGRRWFDLDAVRTAFIGNPMNADGAVASGKDNNRWNNRHNTHAGAPPLDWHTDLEDGGDWLWKLSTAPYKGAHYATYPLALPSRLIQSMCPTQVCVECGEPRRRIVDSERKYLRPAKVPTVRNDSRNDGGAGPFNHVERRTTVGWSDCGHHNYRTGVVLDPFAGSGTTAIAAAIHHRDATLIDIDRRNLHLIHQRITDRLNIIDRTDDGDTVTWSVTPATVSQVTANRRNQPELFDVDGAVS